MPSLRLPAAFVLLAALIAGCREGWRPPEIPRPAGRPNLQSVLVKESGRGRERFTKDAIAEYGAYLAYHPEDAEGHLEFGMLLVDTDNFAEGLFHLRLFCDNAPDSEKLPLAQKYIEKATVALTGNASGAGASATPDEELLQDIKAKNLRILELGKTIEDLQASNDKLVEENERLGNRVSSLERRVQLMLNGADTAPAAPRRSQELASHRLETPAPDPRPVRQPAQPSASAGGIERNTGVWTVRQGDSLWTIAQKVYGDASRNKDIRAANPGKIGPNDSLTVGDELICP